MTSPPRRSATRGIDGRVVVAASIGLVVVVVDQATKAIFESWDCGDVICPLRNDELMLGVAGGTNAQILAWTVAGLALYGLWVWAARRRAKVPPIAIALVISGVVGNLIDRLALGSVRDFFGFVGNTVINVADVALVVGMVASVGAVVVASVRSAPRSG